MDKSSKYTGVIIFAFSLLVTVLVIVFLLIKPLHEKSIGWDKKVSTANSELQENKRKQSIIEANINKIKGAMAKAQKKVYAPADTGLENETLFFTLYSDLMEMIHTNGIKIKSINYDYNPENDPFVRDGGKDAYFVCDINMEIISNYVSLGKFIQEVYQYPYYIRINEVDVKPYKKDKKILISDVSLRLYAHTEPQEELQTSEDEVTLDGAETALPQ